MNTSDRLLLQFNSSQELGFNQLAESIGFGADLTSYYLRKLIIAGAVEKLSRGRYRISSVGRRKIIEISNKLQNISNSRPILMLLIKSGEQYWVVRRQRQPYVGKLEWPTFGFEAGVSVDSQVRSALGGLDTESCQMIGLFRRIDVVGGVLFDDKLFFVHVVELGTIDIVSLNTAGEWLALGELDIANQSQKSLSLVDILEFSKVNKFYEERKYDL
jgi:hypothetical protein